MKVNFVGCVKRQRYSALYIKHYEGRAYNTPSTLILDHDLGSKSLQAEVSLIDFLLP